MRRTLFFVGLVIGIALAAFFYDDIRYLLSRKTARFKAVPVESALFFDVKGLKHVREAAAQQKPGVPVEQLGLFQKAKEIRLFFAWFDSSSTNPFLRDIDFENLLVAVNSPRGGVIELSYVLQMNEATEAQLKTWLADNPSVRADVRKVRGKRLYDLVIPDAGRWTVGFWHRLCVVSRNTALVEDAIVQLKGAANITDDKSFQPMNNADAFVHLYVNFPRLANIAQGFASDEAQVYTQTLGRFATWMGVSFEPSANGLVVNGYAASQESFQALNNYRTPDTYKIWALQQKPDNTSFLISTGVPAEKPDSKSFFATLDFRKYFAGWLDGEVSYVLVEPVDTSYANQSLLFLRTKNADATFEALAPLNQASNDSMGRLPVRYKTFTIHQLAQNGMMERLMPNPFTEFSSPYYTVAGNYAVMSNSLTQLKLYLERYGDDKTLDHVKIKGLNTGSFATGSYNVYFDIGMLSDMFLSGARADLKDNVSLNANAFSAFAPVYLQFTPHKNAFNVTGFVTTTFQQAPLAKAGQYLWKAAFDTAIALVQPLGDRSTGEKQIAVQDHRHVLYVLNRGGNVVWRKQLDGPIQGRLHSVDFYRNGDRQYVFATNRKIFMVDRAGDAVQNFPIAFPCTAVTPLSVIDPDENGDYKYLIGCENGFVYGYEKGGRPMAGWNPNIDADGIVTSIQHFRYRSREFIMGVTQDGWLKFFNRYGESVNRPLPVPASVAPFVADDQRGFRTITPDGTEYRLDYDGEVYEIAAPLDAVSDAMLFDAVPSKPGYERIVFDGKRIVVYASDSNRVKQFVLPKTSNGKLTVLKRGADDYYVGVSGSGSVTMFKSDGEMVNGFPQKAQGTLTPIDLYNNSRPVLVGLVDDQTVIAYPLE